MNKKDLLAGVLSGTGVLSACRQLLTPRSNALPILAYHRVKPLLADYPFDSELISATPEDFLWQMQHIREHYTPLRLNQLGEYFAGQKPWPARPVVITFDDGFDDNYRYAFPVLQQLNIPATLFVATDYIDTNNSYWFDWAVFLLKRLASPITLQAAEPNGCITLDPQQPLKLMQREFFLRLKQISEASRQELLQQLARHIDGVTDAAVLAHSQPMSWENIREMVNSGLIDIGSHTCSHPILNQIPRAQMVTELQQSKQKIEMETGRPCTTMAYPFGGEDIASPAVVDAVKNAGYALGCMYQQGYARRTPDDLFKLDRIHVETDISRAQFAAMLALPGIFA